MKKSQIKIKFIKVSSKFHIFQDREQVKDKKKIEIVTINNSMLYLIKIYIKIKKLEIFLILHYPC